MYGLNLEDLSGKAQKVKEHRFWGTQPVPQLKPGAGTGDDAADDDDDLGEGGPIDKPKTVGALGGRRKLLSATLLRPRPRLPQRTCRPNPTRCPAASSGVTST